VESEDRLPALYDGVFDRLVCKHPRICVHPDDALPPGGRVDGYIRVYLHQRSDLMDGESYALPDTRE